MGNKQEDRADRQNLGFGKSCHVRRYCLGSVVRAGSEPSHGDVLGSTTGEGKQTARKDTAPCVGGGDHRESHAVVDGHFPSF